ncbi:MAG: polysaccharide deacetylase family protein [Verrucomicrobiota bacterium]
MRFHFQLGFFIVGATVLFNGCERVSPYLDKVKEALDREATKEIEEKIVELDIPPPPEPVAMEPIINKEARVAILGYHDFTTERSTNDMVLNIEDFRDQMQAIVDADLPVISMRQFLDWKQGKEDIPPESVMITIDDGWKATHTLAMSVLQEFGFPYTIFLYKDYVGVGGRSLSFDEVRELAANGATISSHSISHQNMSRRGGRSEQSYQDWLKEELETSHDFLVENFGDTGAIVKTFAYPYGIYNDLVIELAREFGYEACFTVNGKKTIWEVDDMEVGRYVVHGTTLANFDPALNFGGGNMTSSGRKLLTATPADDGKAEAPLVTVRPEANSTIGNRLPLIEVDLSRLEGVSPDSLTMRMTGFGKVPHQFDVRRGFVSYQVPQRLRLDLISVQLAFRHAGNEDYEIISWEFKLDRLADYLSSDVTEPGTNESIEPDSPEEDGSTAAAEPGSRSTTGS